MVSTIRIEMYFLSKILLSFLIIFNVHANADCTDLPAFDFTSGKKISTKYINQLVSISGIERVQTLQAWSIEGIDELKKTILFCGMPDDLKRDIELVREKLKTIKFKRMSDNECLMRTRVDANAWTMFYSDTIFFCDTYFHVKDPRSQFTILIHELLHTVGLDHGHTHSDRIQVLTLLLARVDNWKDYVRFSSTSIGWSNEELIICLTNSKCRKKFNSKKHSVDLTTEWMKVLSH